MGVFESGSSEGASGASRFGALGFPLTSHVGSNAGKEVLVKRVSGEMGGISSLSVGLRNHVPILIPYHFS